MIAGRSVRVGVTALAPKSRSCDEKVGGISAEPYTAAVRPAPTSGPTWWRSVPSRNAPSESL
ncbi:Uncharacterised protein [Mycobacterium tuberculosis]|nr:Uncharacterised protein [Mycobacterium tuberculosis]